MDTIFMNSKNGKTSKPQVLIHKLTDKLDLRRGRKSIALSNLSFIKNIKNLYNNNKFKISDPTWNDKLELPDGPYSVSDIQDYFEYILKCDSSIKIYANKIEIRVTFKIKTGYYLELLMPETMKILASTENKIKIVKMHHIQELQK